MIILYGHCMQPLGKMMESPHFSYCKNNKQNTDLKDNNLSLITEQSGSKKYGITLNVSISKESSLETCCCTWLIDRKHGPNQRAVSRNSGKDYKTLSRK